MVLGIYYAKARMYDPGDRRFMAADPIMGNVRNPQTLNLFVYCLDNPLKYIDPLGELSISYSASKLIYWIKSPVDGKDYYLGHPIIGYSYGREGPAYGYKYYFDSANVARVFGGDGETYGLNFRSSFGKYLYFSYSDNPNASVDLVHTYKVENLDNPGMYQYTPFVNLKQVVSALYSGYFTNLVCNDINGNLLFTVRMTGSKYGIDYNLDEDEKLFIAVMFAESSVSNQIERKAVSHSVNNRVDSTAKRWNKQNTVAAVLKAPFQYSGYNDENYKYCRKYLDKRDGANVVIESVISDCMPVYKRQEFDTAKGAESYFSPRSMAYGTVPDWAQPGVDNFVEVTVPGVRPDYYRFYKYTGK